MKVITGRLLEKMEKLGRVKAKLGHRTISKQIKKYIYNTILCEENADLPLSFIEETLHSKAEIEAGLGEE